MINNIKINDRLMVVVYEKEIYIDLLSLMIVDHSFIDFECYQLEKNFNFYEIIRELMIDNNLRVNYALINSFVNCS